MKRESIRQLQTAAAHFGAGRLDKAEAICRVTVSNHPQAIDAVHLLALVRRRQGDAEEALSLFEACLRQAPERVDIRANFGNFLHAAGQTAAAISEYRKALEADSSFRPALIALARTLNASGEHAPARAEAERLIDKNPEDAEAWVALGVALRGLGQADAAAAAYRKALQIYPGYGAAHHNLGALLAQLSRSEESLAELELAREAGVQGPEIAFNQSAALAGLYRFDEAEAVLVEDLKSTPSAFEAQRQLARLRFMRGDEDFAAGIKDAVASAPAHIPLRVAYAQILLAAGQVEDACSVLTEAAQVDEEDPAISAELALVHQEAGRYSEALQCAQAAAGGFADESSRTDAIIDALMSLGRADEAMPLIESARDRFPSNQWYIAMEATAARLLGDPRYERLYDYERFVQPFELEAPRGWTSMDEFQRDLVPALIGRHRFHAHPLDQSLRHGTQTPRGLLGDPDPIIVAFLDALQAPIERYRAHVGDDQSHPMTKRNRGELHMTGCWSVRLRKGGFHVNHVHPQGWLSSAYYAEVPDEVSDEKMRSGWIKFGEPRFPVPGATAEKFVQPRAGMLVLFPSYMWHGTTPIHGDDPRMTIAFDAVCRNEAS